MGHRQTVYPHMGLLLHAMIDIEKKSHLGLHCLLEGFPSKIYMKI